MFTPGWILGYVFLILDLLWFWSVGFEFALVLQSQNWICFGFKKPQLDLVWFWTIWSCFEFALDLLWICCNFYSAQHKTREPPQTKAKSTMVLFLFSICVGGKQNVNHRLCAKHAKHPNSGGFSS